MANTDDLMDELRSHLLDNLTDPNPRRRSEGDDWIFTVPIRLGASMPRIHIHEVSAEHNQASIGNTDQLMRERIQISLYYDAGHKFDVDDDNKEERALAAVKYLARRIQNEIQDNQSTWRSVGDGSYKSLITIAEEQRPTEKEKVIRHDIDARAFNER